MPTPRSPWTAADARTAWAAYEGHMALSAPPTDSPSTIDPTEVGDFAEGASTYLDYMATVRDQWAADHDSMVSHLRAHPDVYGTATGEMITRYERLAREARAGAKYRRDLAARIRAEGMPPRGRPTRAP